MSAQSASTSHIATPSSLATVFLPDPFHPKAEAYAERRFQKVLRPNQDGMNIDACLAICDGVLLRVGEMTGKDIRKATRLRMISRNGTGCDSIDLVEANASSVRVSNCPGGNAKAVAELALSLMLTVLRRVLELDHRIRSGEIVRTIDVLSPGLSGKTVGLVGMGDTAYHTARLLLAFDCNLLVYSPSSPRTRWRDGDGEARHPDDIPHERVDSLEDLLRRIDVLSLHCPMKKETRNLIGKKELGMMKASAVVINTSRGGIIDEDALVEALKAGRLAGAGLDVFKTEPAHGETLGDFRDMLNVVCLPHVGGSTDEVTYNGCMKAIDQLADYFDGKGIVNQVV